MKHKKRINYSVFRSLALPLIASKVGSTTQSLISQLLSESSQPVSVGVVCISPKGEKSVLVSLLKSDSLKQVLEKILASADTPALDAEEAWIISFDSAESQALAVVASKWNSPRLVVDPTLTFGRLRKGATKGSFEFRLKQADPDIIYKNLVDGHKI